MTIQITDRLLRNRAILDECRRLWCVSFVSVVYEQLKRPDGCLVNLMPSEPDLTLSNYLRHAKHEQLVMRIFVTILFN